MGLGFEVTNDAGSKQVIDTAPLITFKDKFTVIPGDANNGYINYDYIFACQPSDGSTLLVTTYLYRYEDQKKKDKIIGSGELVRFNDGAAPIGGERFGLEVYNEQGVLQFSSNQRPLKILDRLYNNDIRDIETVVGGRRTYWSKDYGNKKVAALMLGAPAWGEDPHFMTVAPAKRGSVFAFEAAIENTDAEVFDYLGNPIPMWRIHALILDVTNY